MREHLNRNIVRMGSKWFTQIRGIPQVKRESRLPEQNTLKFQGLNFPEV